MRLIRPNLAGKEISAPFILRGWLFGFTAGVITNTSATYASLGFSATTCKGGITPYSYQWKYRLHNGGSYTNFGTSSLTAILIGLEPITSYDIELVYTDTDGNKVNALMSGVKTAPFIDNGQFQSSLGFGTWR